MDLCKNSNSSRDNNCANDDGGGSIAGDDGESKQIPQIICKKPFVFKNNENG